MKAYLYTEDSVNVIDPAVQDFNERATGYDPAYEGRSWTRVAAPVGWAPIQLQFHPKYEPVAPYGVDKDFTWMTEKGQWLKPRQMTTPHLFYALRKVFNHEVPPVFRVLRAGETMKRYPEVAYWATTYRTAAITALRAELAKRNDLPEDMQLQLADMMANTRVILQLGL